MNFVEDLCCNYVVENSFFFVVVIVVDLLLSTLVNGELTTDLRTRQHELAYLSQRLKTLVEILFLPFPLNWTFAPQTVVVWCQRQESSLNA